MQDSLICHALCSDPACESEHATECVKCGSRTCYSLDPVCSCGESEPDEYEPAGEFDPYVESATRGAKPQRFLFRFTYPKEAR